MGRVELQGRLQQVGESLLAGDPADEYGVGDGRVDTVLSRGTVVVDGDRFVGTKGHGQYLRRGLSSYLI